MVQIGIFAMLKQIAVGGLYHFAHSGGVGAIVNVFRVFGSPQMGIFFAS